MESNNNNNMLPSNLGFGSIDLQGSMRLNHNQHPHGLQQPHHCQTRQGLMPHLPGHEVFPLTMGQNHECDKRHSVDRPNNFHSDEEENGLHEDGMNDPSKGKKVPWQRVKWADSMVRLLITAVSYLGEDVIDSGVFGRRKLSALHKKGKWKLASKVMGERGFYVSPQQCEDKFNDLNKRYKKLNEILGRGTSCQVVEKPALLDLMDHLSDKTKDEVRKILSSKQLFYEEMCSYHNNNRLHLPHDPALQKSLQLALRNRDDDDTDSKKGPHDDEDDHEHDHDGETDEYEDYDENRYSRVRKMPGQGLEFNFGDPCSFPGFSKGLESQPHPGVSNEWLKSRSLELEEKRLQIETEMLELEKERFKWQRFSKKKDLELEKLKMENDRMKLENEGKALELKRLEMSINCNK